VILAGHTNTERGWLKVLRRRLRSDLHAEISISRNDRDPLRTA
jgi:putative NIF3 family GTP cyclohydrolase 1 type 2